MKQIIVSLRLDWNGNWTMTKQDSRTHCNRCGARLWIAPSGAKYCNAVSEKHKPENDKKGNI